MIISHEHRYLFVELYHTGSTAVSRELCELYGGEPILRKHSFYRDFARQASADERRYFTFSTIRNPLEVVASFYYKYRNDHDEYENPANWSRNGGWVTPLILRQYRFVKETNCSFAGYLRHFHWYPYDNWSRLDHHRMDYVMRFERLAEDFDLVLRRIGIEPVRPLPRANVTAGKPREPEDLHSPEVRELAIRSFGPFMRRWGYDFPEAWGDVRVPASARLAFEATGLARHVRWAWLSRTRAPRRADAPAS